MMTLDRALLTLDAIANKLFAKLSSDGIGFSHDHDRGEAVFTIMTDQADSLVAWVNHDWFHGCCIKVVVNGNPTFALYCANALRGE